MTVDVTILNAATELGGPFTTPRIREHMGVVKANNFSGCVHNIFKRGFLNKKKNATGSGNLWSVTKQGQKFLKDNTHRIYTPEEFIEKMLTYGDSSLTGSPSRKSAPPKVTKSANSAIDGLTALIDENQHLNGLLRSIAAQINAALPADETEEV